MAKEQVVEEVKEEGLTLEKFEEASEEVKQGHPGNQSWFTVSIFLLPDRKQGIL